MTIPSLLSVAIEASILAGEEINTIYQKDFQVEFKDDQSPLTEADLAAEKIIAKKLEQTLLPIISEENTHLPYEIRKNWQKVWIVDPLDGTKEFVNRNGEFTVNIALIESGNPTLGVIYAPTLHMLYFGTNNGAFEMKISPNWTVEQIMAEAKRIHCIKPKDVITLVASRSHSNQETIEFIHHLQSEKTEVKTVTVGSSLKFCLVASGKAHLYPRFGKTMEWDIAAGHAIINAAGGSCMQPDGNSISYNKENLRNPNFIVSSALAEDMKTPQM